MTENWASREDVLASACSFDTRLTGQMLNAPIVPKNPAADRFVKH